MTTGFTTYGPDGGIGPRVDLGQPEHIPDNEVRDVYVKLGEKVAEVSALVRRRDELEERRRDHRNNAPESLSDKLWRGEDIEEEDAAIAAEDAALTAHLDATNRRIQTVIGATRTGRIELELILDERAGELVAASIAKAKTIRSKLALADRVLNESIGIHEASMGLVHLIEAREAGDPTFQVRQIVKNPQVALGLAVEHARRALAMLDDEIATATALHKAAKKSRAKAAADAAVAAAVTPQPAEAITITATAESDEETGA